MGQLAEVAEVAVVGEGNSLTVSETAALLGVSTWLVRKWADEGELDAPEKVWWAGSHRRIPRRSAERKLKELRGEG